MADKETLRKIPREEPGYRARRERVHDWNEVQSTVTAPLIRRQAQRCMDCGVPFCQGDTGCPVHNEIPRWNELAARGLWAEALDRLHETNNFPEFTGRLCPAPCEAACVLGLESESVTIRNVEWSIIEKGYERNLVHPRPATARTGRSVAVVGSGPAGLAAAQELARAGHDVTVFEKNARPGGLLRYGIPDFKLEKWRLERRLLQLVEEGVAFRCSVTIGRDITLQELQEDFDAVALAIGAEIPRDLSIPGRHLKGVHFAMDYLARRNRLQAREPLHEELISAQGRHVIILGGGDTGSDCLGTALREGARSVRQFELLPRPPQKRDAGTPWPLWPLQLRSSHAHEEGGLREWSLNTRELVGDRGFVKSLRAERIAWSDGRFRPTGEEPLEFPADLVILALGFQGPRLSLLPGEQELRRDARGNIATDESFMTSIPGIFAAGDAKRGASLIVWAIAEGRRMAHGISRYLGESSLRLH